MATLAARYPQYSYSRSSSASRWATVVVLDTWLVEAFDKINELRNLQSNWDSYGADRVTDGAELSARWLMSYVNWQGIPSPTISALADGGIGMHWNIGARDLEIEIDPSGELTYLQSQAGTMKPGSVTKDNVQDVVDWILEV